jgi:Flp pilus assembly protein TadG
MKEKVESESGQAMVVLAGVLVGLLVIAGLALDGGTAFLDRRRMQNAADAAALAGTRRLSEAICDDEDPSLADAAINAAVIDYAMRNGVEDPGAVAAQYVKFAGAIVTTFDSPLLVGSGLVPNGAAGVEVAASVSRDTVLMSLAGQDTTGATASAIAVTGPPKYISGLHPFGVPVEMLDKSSIGAGDCFTSKFKNCGAARPEECYIVDDFGNIIGAHRNWLNFNQVWNTTEAPGFPRALESGSSAAELAGWMTNGWPETAYADCPWAEGCFSGDFIHAKPGSDSSVINSTPIDTPFVVPIFDLVPHYSQIPPEKAEDVPQGGSYYYHVVGFATVTVGPGDAQNGPGTVRACMSRKISGEGVPSSNAGFGSNACMGQTMYVALWE